MDSELRDNLILFHLGIAATANDRLIEASATTIALVLDTVETIPDMAEVLEKAPQTEMIVGFIAVLKEMEENHSGNN